MNSVFGIVGIVLTLWLGKPLLLPLVTAVFLWYLTKAIAAYYKKIVRSGIFANILAGASIIGVVYFFLSQIQPMLMDLYMKLPEITAGAEKILAEIAEATGTKISLYDLPSFSGFLAGVGSAIANIGTVFIMILVYIVFLFVEQSTFPMKLRALFQDRKKFTKLNFILHSIDAHMKKYLFVKTIISLGTAVFSYIGLAFLGVDFAILWAFFVFVLNYIPTIGSIVAGALPTIYVFAMTGEIKTPLLVALWIAFMNLIFGNILDPKLTGKSLNLSALVILVNMVFWGMIWGPIGMFFSVPIMVAAHVAFAQFDSTRWISVLLSADGSIPDKNED